MWYTDPEPRSGGQASGENGNMYQKGINNWSKYFSFLSAYVHARSLQSCLTLCNPMDYSPLCSSVHGILQARILEWVPCPPPGDLPNPGIELASLVSPALSDGFFTTSTTREAPFSLDTLPSLLHFTLLARVLPCFSVSRLQEVPGNYRH